MKYSSVIIWLVGLALIALLCFLVSDYFLDQRLLYLDGGVLICIYTLFLYVYSGLFTNAEEFARDMPAIGIRIPAFWLYSALAVIGIIAGFVYAVPFTWQTFYQLCFLFIMLVGLLTSAFSTERLHHIADTSQQRQQPKEQLVNMAQQLRVTASTNKNVDDKTRKSIDRIAERVTFISPSNSPLALSLETSLSQSLNNIHELLNSSFSPTVLADEIEKAQSLLSQRMKTY